MEFCKINEKGKNIVKSKNNLVGMSLMFLVLAVSTSLAIWGDVSLAAKIGMFAFGFGSGVTLGGVLAMRSK